PGAGETPTFRQAEESTGDRDGIRTRGDRRRGALVRLGQAVARARGHDRTALRAAEPVRDPPHPAHLPRPDRRRRHPPTRLTSAGDYKRVICRARGGIALRDSALLSRICAPEATELSPRPPLSTGAMIKTQNLTKSYDGLLAVDDLSFSVEPGEVLGFLGPNGAGKSTTMRMLAGFITPTSGTGSICGHDIATDALAAKAALGYLPEGAPLYAEMTVRGLLDFIADLRRLAGAHRKARLDYVIGRLQLEPVIAQTIETLSKGFK